MTEISEDRLINSLKELIVKANTELRPDVFDALREAQRNEDAPNGKKVLAMLVENADIAKSEGKPLCQDTGYVDIYLGWPKDLALIDNLQTIADDSVRLAYSENSYRNSMVFDPLFGRKNTQDNTPANIYIEQSDDKQISARVFIKGGGADNSSALFMLSPTSSVNEVERVIIKQIKEKASKSCPPLIIGVGIGSTFNKVSVLSKKALFRKIGEPNKNRKYADLETRILNKVNSLGIGPSGLGGKNTALAMMIEQAPCHMATLPLALSLNCCVLRSASRIIKH